VSVTFYVSAKVSRKGRAWQERRVGKMKGKLGLNGQANGGRRVRTGGDLAKTAALLFANAKPLTDLAHRIEGDKTAGNAGEGGGDFPVFEAVGVIADEGLVGFGPDGVRHVPLGGCNIREQTTPNKEASNDG
jgi:hypothetical protein